MEYKGRQVGAYRLLFLVGEGGMGAVFKAKDTQSGAEVALKFIIRRKEHSDDAMTLARRLRDEAVATSAVTNPHLARLISTGEDEELGPYVVYEFLSGGSLRSFLDKEGPLGIEATLSCVARPLLLGLHSLHEEGIIHRDVKPDNLLNCGDGIYKLGDLGLAHFEGRQAKTRTGVIVGTPGYVAPEMLLDGDWKPTSAADCYAAALVIIEAATGKMPFKGEGAALVRSQLATEPSCGSLVRLGLPHSVARVLTEALLRDPEIRCNCAKELYESLQKAVKAKVGMKTSLSAVAKVAICPVEEKPKRSPLRFLPWSVLLFVLLFIAYAQFGTSDRYNLGVSHAAPWRDFESSVIAMNADDEATLSAESYYRFLLAKETLMKMEKGKLLPWEILQGKVRQKKLTVLLVEAAKHQWEKKEHKTKKLLMDVLEKHWQFLSNKTDVSGEQLGTASLLLSQLCTLEVTTAKERLRILRKARSNYFQLPEGVSRQPWALSHRSICFLLWALQIHESKLSEEIDDIEPALRGLCLLENTPPIALEIIKRVWSFLEQQGKHPPILDQVSYVKRMNKNKLLAVAHKRKAVALLQDFRRKVNKHYLFVGGNLRQMVGPRTFLRPFRKAFWLGMVSCFRQDNLTVPLHNYVHIQTSMFEMVIKEMWSPYYASAAKDGAVWGIGFTVDDMKSCLLDTALLAKSQYFDDHMREPKWRKACEYFDVSHPVLGFKGSLSTKFHNKALELLVPPGEETNPPCALLLSVGLWSKRKRDSAVTVLERVVESQRKELKKIYSLSEEPDDLHWQLSFCARATWDLLRRLARMKDLARYLRGMKMIKGLRDELKTDWIYPKRWQSFYTHMLFVHYADIAMSRTDVKDKRRYRKEAAELLRKLKPEEHTYIAFDYFLTRLANGQSAGF